MTSEASLLPHDANRRVIPAEHERMLMCRVVPDPQNRGASLPIGIEWGEVKAVRSEGKSCDHLVRTATVANEKLWNAQELLGPRAVLEGHNSGSFGQVMLHIPG